MNGFNSLTLLYLQTESALFPYLQLEKNYEARKTSIICMYACSTKILPFASDVYNFRSANNKYLLL